MSRKPSQSEIVAARLRLRDRFLAKTQVPVDQTPAAPGKWPVLDLGGEPRVTRRACRSSSRSTS